jgi:hypothetical protein
MWIALTTAIALPLIVSLLLFRVRLHGHNLDGSDLPHMDM